MATVLTRSSLRPNPSSYLFLQTRPFAGFCRFRLGGHPIKPERNHPYGSQTVR